VRRWGPPMSRDETTQIVGWVERLKRGDDSAFEELLIHFDARLLRLTRKRLKTFPAVRRWEQTDDVLQPVAIVLGYWAFPPHCRHVAAHGGGPRPPSRRGRRVAPTPLRPAIRREEVTTPHSVTSCCWPSCMAPSPAPG
jgi:hypothetical protein